MKQTLHIIGAGLAGSEAAWQAAEAGVSVVIHEMRGVKPTEAHHTADCAELVCSNSFRSDDHTRNAVGLLHEEMRRCDSLILKCADAHKVPAGGALAVDREAFAKAVTAALESHPNIRFERGEISALPASDDGLCIVATGPLTSGALSASILARGVFGVFRCDCADCHPRIHRYELGVVSVALRQGRGGGLHQLPDE